MRQIRKTIVLTTLLLAQASSAWACPMCKYALESSDAEPRAYMISILFMLGAIGSLFFGVAGLLWWVTKIETKKLRDAGYQHLFDNAGSQPHLAKVKAD